MFDKERFVYFNGVRLGNNGFKNLSFETSRFSDSFSSIRGFGSHLNEKNLSIVDAFSIEFFVDYKELASIAETYVLFKALGVLKLDNEYILDKVASSLSHEKAIQEVLINYENKDGKSKDDIIKNKVSSLLVFLERMDITSLEKTNNGYSVNLVLSLLKDGFNETQGLTYMSKFEKWKEDSGFHEATSAPIAGYISELGTKGGLDIEIFNIEILNAKQKEKVLLNYKDDYLKELGDKEKLEEKLNDRVDVLNTYEEYEPEKISIPAHNIAQIQLMTNNTISNIPITGEPIGEKSFMGIDKTGFTVKLIFDESDNEIIEKIKKLSDLNITKHKMRVSNPLINLFDFKTGVITNVFFNNTESSNGIMVTIKFELSAYDYFSDNFNTDSIVDFSGKSITSNDAYMTNLYLEALCSETLDVLNTEEKDEFYMDVELDSPLDVTITNSRGAQGDINQETTYGKLQRTAYTLVDFLSAYSSDITAMGGHTAFTESLSQETVDGNTNVKKARIHRNYIKTKNLEKIVNNETAQSFYYPIKDGIDKNIFGDASDKKAANAARKDLNGGYLFRFLDMVSLTTLYKTEEAKKRIRMESNSQALHLDAADLNSFAFSKDGGVISTLVIEQTIREFFNDKVQTLDDRTLLYYKTIYRTFFYDLLMNTEKLTVLKSIKNKESYITTQGIDFTEIRSTIKTVINEHLNMTIKTINNRSFKSDATSMILSELVEGMNQKTFGHTYKNVEEFVETATEDATSQFKKLYTDIEKATDKAMGFFLTKFMYSMIFLIGQGDNSYIVNLIKSHILSAGAMGFLSMKTKYRTDSFGYAYDTSSKIISKTLNSFFFVHKKRLEKENEKLILENNLDRKLLEEFFEGKVKYSSYIDKVTLNFFEMERNIINEQNKDYNFFYGNRIKNDGICMFLNDVFKETSELKTLNDNVEAYLLTKFTQFDKGEKFCDEIPNIKYGYDERIWKKPFSYDSLNVARNGKITDVTKKRIIGENNVFNDLEKINKIVNNPVYDVMPDYEVLIKKRDLDEFGAVGFRNDFSISSVFLLKNVIKINIIIDPVTKIKTASITSVDVGKRIVDKTKDGAISVQVSTTKKTTVVSGSEDGLPILKTEDKETIELFSIESGDVIEIRLGSFRNKELDLRDETLNKDFRKSVVFRGTISSIKDGGGLINIDCVNTASVLYSISNKEVQIGSESLLSKATNFVTTSFSYLFGTRDKSITLDELNSYKEAKGCNNHLFEAIGDMDYNKLRGEQEECSMYNAAHFALGNLPSVSTNLITGGNLNNSGLASRKMVISQMSESFGIMSEIEDPRSKAINPDIYKNIYNVDKDYDTYGIMLQPVSETIIRDLTDEEYSKYNVYNNKKEDSYNSNAEFENKEENPSVNSSAENGVENSTIVEEIVGLPKGDVGFAWPTKSKLITSVFDMNRWHPELKKYKAHRAIDIGRLRDNKGQIVNSVNYIYASRDGVCTVGSNNKGAGRFVHIDHNLEIDGKKIPCFTFYCHLNTINVKQGQRVKAGDVIATMGASGLKDANQIHLHFEISINKEKIDPTIYLKGGKIK